MRRRRPDQLSMLKLMGADEGRPPPFAGTKVTRMVTDSDGNVTDVTTVGPGCPGYAEEFDVDPWWDQPVQLRSDDDG